MRESISKLDRCRAYAYNDRLTKEKVYNILGIVDDEDFTKLLKCINENNIVDAIGIVNDCIDKGKDIVEFVNDFIWHLRNILIAYDLKEPLSSLNITKNSFTKLKEESKNYVMNELISQNKALYYWKSGNTAEVDFIYENDGKVVPVEVKAATNTQAKSYKQFCKKFEPLLIKSC